MRDYGRSLCGKLAPTVRGKYDAFPLFLGKHRRVVRFTRAGRVVLLGYDMTEGVMIRSFSTDEGFWWEMTDDWRMRVLLEMLKKPVTTVDGKVVAKKFSDPFMVEQCPLVLSYLVETQYEDGSARRTSTLTLFVDDGQLKASLNDRDNSRTAFVSADSLAELLEALECHLSDPTSPWRSDRKDNPPGGRKQKQ